MWHLGIWFSRHGGVGLMVGLDDLRGLFQPMILWFYDIYTYTSRAYDTVTERKKTRTFDRPPLSEMLTILVNKSKPNPKVFEFHFPLSSYIICISILLQ